MDDLGQIPLPRAHEVEGRLAELTALVKIAEADGDVVAAMNFQSLHDSICDEFADLLKERS